MALDNKLILREEKNNTKYFFHPSIHYLIWMNSIKIKHTIALPCIVIITLKGVKAKVAAAAPILRYFGLNCPPTKLAFRASTAR